MTEEERAQLKELIAWKRARETQQITFPLDPKSLEILSQYFMRFVDEAAFEFVGAASHIFPYFFGKQGDRTFEMSSTYIRVGANPDTDQIVVSDRNQFTKFSDGQRVSFKVDELTGGIYPGGITDGFGDFVVANASADGFTFTLEDFGTSAPIDITSFGTGKLYITKYL